MSLLAKRSIIKEDKSNIITLGAIAQKEKAKDKTVVNATIGMLYDEEEKLLVFESVNEALTSLTDFEKYGYASTPGNKDFHDALKHWVFREYEEEILSKMFCDIMATPGGIGAISNTFSNYLNEGEKALLPNYMWGNYKQIAYENYASYDTYKLFNDEGKFNLNDIYNKMIELKKAQNRILLVINDPCHNPTGYSMSYEEWVSLTNMINELSSDGTPFILLYDMAYIDYDSRGLTATRENIRLFKNFNKNVLVVLAFSGSKTMALYGVRIGAQIALSTNEANIIEFSQANKFSCRAKWSNSTNLGMNLITKVLNDEKLETKFMEELEVSRKILSDRAQIFINNSKEVGLLTLPFVCGFFITIPCANPNLVYERLVKRGIHIIPMGDVLRVTLSAINKEACARLPKEIKECME